MNRLAAIVAALLSLALCDAGLAQSAGSPRPTSQRVANRKAARPAAPFRHASVDAAWRAAQESGRPVLVFVTSANCFYCKKMVTETLAHPQIARANNLRFETAVLSNERQPELVAKLGVKAFPTTLVVNPDGSLANEVRGFVKPAKFVAQVFADPKSPRQASSSAATGGSSANTAKR